MKVCVLGGGSFGTALGFVLDDLGRDVTIWARDREVVDDINKQHANSRYLPEVSLGTSLEATDDLARAVEAANVVFVAVPSSAVREVTEQAVNAALPESVWISCTKGIEEPGFLLMSEVLAEVLDEQHQTGVLSGPNLAKEMVQKSITASVIASHDSRVINTVHDLLSCDYFRIYGNGDVYGVELAGALKNIYAVACGMSDALGMGQNTKSMLITRSLAEMSRFAQAAGGNAASLLGLAGVGDLVVTCSSNLSRNYRAGFYLGEGLQIEQALEKLGQTAEGINTIKLVHRQAASQDIYMPIASGLYSIIYDKVSMSEVISSLMQSEQNQDVEFVAV